MRRFLYEHGLELRFFLYLTLWVSVFSAWKKYDPQKPIIQILVLISFITFGLLAYFAWKKIWRENLRTPILGGIKSMFVRVTRFAMRFMGYFERFGIRGNVINGKTSVSYDLFAMSKSRKGSKEKRVPPPRWKDMNTPREKLGYLYYRTVSSYLKRGEKVSAQETPREIAKRFSEDATEKEMFALYNATRYDERKDIDDKTVIRLKDELFDK